MNFIRVIDIETTGEKWNALMAPHQRPHVWQPIDTAPQGQRILVCGWQPPKDGHPGYWWHKEGQYVPGVLPRATHWCPIILPAQFPEPPKE